MVSETTVMRDPCSFDRYTAGDPRTTIATYLLDVALCRLQVQRPVLYSVLYRFFHRSMTILLFGPACDVWSMRQHSVLHITKEEEAPAQSFQSRSRAESDAYHDGFVFLFFFREFERSAARAGGGLFYVIATVPSFVRLMVLMCSWIQRKHFSWRSELPR